MDTSPQRRSAHDGPSNLARRVATLLRNYERNLRSLIDWVDASWLVGLLPPGVAALATDAMERERLSLAIAERVGLIEPALSGFNAGAVNLLGALEIREALDLMRVRALLFRRAELRSWIDRPSRERVGEWVGHDAAFFVRALQVLPDAPKVERLTRAGQAQELGALTAVQLAWEGWNLFACDEGMENHGPSSLLRFALPRELDAVPWIVRRQMFDEGAYGPDNARVFNQVKHWFGQRTWSSGFDSLE